MLDNKICTVKIICKKLMKKYDVKMENNKQDNGDDTKNERLCAI